MNKVDLLMDELKKKFQKMGFGSQDPVINNVLGVLSKAGFEAKTSKDIAMLIGRIETLINLDPDILMNRLKVRIGKTDREAALLAQFYKEREEEIEIDKDRQQDSEQNQDLIELVEEKQEEQREEKQEEQDEDKELFILHRQGKNLRLQVREELEERNLQDRQKALMERSLRILEALEKIKDAMKQEKGMLEIGGNLFTGLNAKEIKQQLGLLKAMGVQGITKDENGNIVENDGRGIGDNGFTEKDIGALERGEAGFAIPLDVLRSMDGKERTEKLQQWFKERGVESDIDKTVDIKGLDELIAEQPSVETRKIEDDEGR